MRRLSLAPTTSFGGVRTAPEESPIRAQKSCKAPGSRSSISINIRHALPSCQGIRKISMADSSIPTAQPSPLAVPSPETASVSIVEAPQPPQSPQLPLIDDEQDSAEDEDADESVPLLLVTNEDNEDDEVVIDQSRKTKTAMPQWKHFLIILSLVFSTVASIFALVTSIWLLVFKPKRLQHYYWRISALSSRVQPGLVLSLILVQCPLQSILDCIV